MFFCQIKQNGLFIFAGYSGNLLANRYVMTLEVLRYVCDLRICAFGTRRFCHCNTDFFSAFK
jgi:hypothetical protein